MVTLHVVDQRYQRHKTVNIHGIVANIGQKPLILGKNQIVAIQAAITCSKLTIKILE